MKEKLEQKSLIRRTALSESTPIIITMTGIFKILIACTINMLAVSTVFMTQSIFLDISEFFNIDITQARFSFSIISLFYSASFFFLGPAADKFDLPKIAVTGLLLLAVTVFGASYATSFGMFITAMALMGNCPLFREYLTKNRSFKNYISRFIYLFDVFPTYGLGPINYINRIRFIIAFL